MLITFTNVKSQKNIWILQIFQLKIGQFCKLASKILRFWSAFLLTVKENKYHNIHKKFEVQKSNIFEVGTKTNISYTGVPTVKVNFWSLISPKLQCIVGNLKHIWKDKTQEIISIPNIQLHILQWELTCKRNHIYKIALS